MISYNPLWKTLVDKGLNKTELCAATGLSSATISKMGKNEYVALTVIEKICKVLQCNIEDVVSIKF